MADILIRKEGHAGRITLTRPKALNALTYQMCLQIDAALIAWASAICFLSARISHDVTNGGKDASSRCTPASASASGYVGCCSAWRMRQLSGAQFTGTLTGCRGRSLALMASVSALRFLIISRGNVE